MSLTEQINAKVASLAELQRAAKRLSGGKANRDDAARRSREQSADAKDIGELPAVADPVRREACRKSFGQFCKTYFPFSFALPFSPDHQIVIEKIQLAVAEGGLFAMAMPRGSGKTTLAEIACLYAGVYGFRQFVFLIGSDKDGAVQMLESIKTELETNELLAADFPEVCFPLAALDGEPRRCKGQTYQGERTRSVWSSGVIVLPTIPGSAASGVIVKVAGITGKIRGQKFKRADGKSVRPSLVIVDDPQSDESANSASQCQTRERTLAGAVLGLAGPGKKIAGVMPTTVIRAGDMSDRILDPKIHPEWNGSRFKLLYEWPANKELWEQYREKRHAYDAKTPGDKERAAAEATDFYLANADAMDAGARVAWPERYNPDELSALQHCMNLLYQDERAFHAEYQNEPLPEIEADADALTPEQIAGKVNRIPRLAVPVECSRLTAFIDVQQTILYYVVCGWADDFTGAVLDYGTFPDQRRPYFVLREVQKTLADVTGAAGLEGQLYAGLKSLTELLIGRTWTREDKAELRIERCLIDANWGQSTDVVKQFCRQSAYSAVLMPSHGKGVGASSSPITARQLKQGERAGLNWVIPLPTRAHVRHVLFDTNFWKSFTHARLAEPMGSPGCLSLFGDSASLHRMLADHLTAETKVRVTAEKSGRTVDEWRMKPGVDNHWFDCTVGCAVAASIGGVSLEKVHQGSRQPGPRRRMSLDEMKKLAREKKR